MAQTTSNDEAADEAATDPFAVTEFARWASLAARLCQAEVQQRITEDLAAGRPVYSAGVGDEADKVFQRLPDGRRFEIRILEDGSIERIRQVL